MKQRLSKVLAQAGIASRRKCEELIFAGKVKVNGRQVLVPQTMVDIENDSLKVEGKLVQGSLEKVYYAVHKPIGYICTSAAHIRKKAIDLIDQQDLRLFTVGRLDKETSGLILITNDGHFAHRVMHPSKGVQKEYIAKVDREITHEHLVALSNGCEVQGVIVKPVSVKKVRKITIRIVVQEGRYHEVREMLEAAGLAVLELKRVRIGPLSLGSMPIGGYKKLSQSQIENLFPEKTV